MLKKIFTFALVASAFIFSATAQSIVSPMPIDLSSMQRATPEIIKASLAQKATKGQMLKAGAADVVGNYTWTYQTSTAYGDTATFTPGYGQVSLTQITGTQDSVIFNGFNLNNMNLKLHAVVNTEQGYVLIPDQIAYNHPTYGNIKAVALYNYNGSWYYEESIGMYINVDGSLTIPDYVFTIITSGAYSGSTYGNYYSSNNFSTMTDGNGIMIVTFNSTLSSDYTTQTYPVKLSQQGNVVAVENFLNMGYTVNINLAADRTITIDKQLVEQGDAEYGDFYTYAADFTNTGATDVSELIAGDVISGIGTDTELSWGKFIAMSTTGYWTGAMETGRIVRTDNLMFIYDQTPAVKIGDVNNDGDINVLDVTALINYILGKNPSPFNLAAADVNGEDGINVMDVTALINLVLSNE